MNLGLDSFSASRSFFKKKIAKHLEKELIFISGLGRAHGSDCALVMKLGI